MYPFTYHRPRDLREALARLSSDPEARPLAGGMTLIPSMKHRLSAPSQLIDIARLPELRGISRIDDHLVVGAASRYAEIAADPAVAAALPALAQVAESIGDPQVRSRGTLGGSIANNDPAADFPAAVLALSAIIRTDRREVAADDYFQGMFTTALLPDELICAIRFAIPHRAAYAKFHHPASGYAMTGVFVADFGDTVRVAVTGAAPVVFRWHDAEAALARDLGPASVADLRLAEEGLNADLHAPAAYRAQLAAVLLQEAVQQIQGTGQRLPREGSA
jgi:aerobic carbon-monoxide dehydrogenase medium subunit